MGVAIDRTTKPPRLYGQTELPLESEADALRVFAAIASRNTAGTGMNDSSSRSHCFAFVTLHVHDDGARAVRTSRFQFVDLAGSERLRDAHNGLANWRTDGMEVVAGMVTNFSLMMLSSCTRALVDAQRRGKAKNFSFRAYIGDLCPVRSGGKARARGRVPILNPPSPRARVVFAQLLQESMTGHALTAIFVCLSQAPDNCAQSKYALDFGEVFSHLAVRPRRQPAEPIAEIVRRNKAQLREAEARLGGTDKYAMIRAAQVKRCTQLLAILDRFGG